MVKIVKCGTFTSGDGVLLAEIAIFLGVTSQKGWEQLIWRIAFCQKIFGLVEGTRWVLEVAGPRDINSIIGIALTHNQKSSFSPEDTEAPACAR